MFCFVLSPFSQCVAPSVAAPGFCKQSWPPDPCLQLLLRITASLRHAVGPRSSGRSAGRQTGETGAVLGARLDRYANTVMRLALNKAQHCTTNKPQQTKTRPSPAGRKIKFSGSIQGLFGAPQNRIEAKETSGSHPPLSVSGL